ncbi:MAG: tetratricopeptide repeat protein [Longimicrobiales bacterium]
MERRLPTWPRALAATLILGAVGTTSGHAQQQPAATAGNKYKVLVPSLERTADARGNFGKDVAEEFRKLMRGMERHEPVERKEMAESLKKFQLKEDEMTCIQNRQLASHMNTELVMCGQFSGTGGSFKLDSVQVIGTKTQESFYLRPFTAATPKEAAQQIFQQFERYVVTLQQLAFCYDYLSSQQWPQAIENCDAAIKANPMSVRANSGKAFALYSQAVAADPADQAKLAESLSLYKKVLEASQIEQDAMRMAGIIAARIGQHEESRKYFASYLEMNPGDVQVRLQIANEQNKAGDPEGALKVVEEGLKTDSASVDLLTWAGVFAGIAASKINSSTTKPEGSMISNEAKPLYEQASKYYKRLFDVKNGDVEPAVVPQMIQSLVVQQRYAEAAEIGTRAIANPKTATGRVYQVYALALAADGKTQEAVAALDAAIAKNDTSATGLRAQKADVILRSGDLSAATAAFRDAISAGETQTDSVANRIWVIAMNDGWQKKDWDGVNKYLEVGNEFAQDAIMKAKLSYYNGLAVYQRAPRMDPKTPKAAEARAALPIWTRAATLVEDGAAFGREQPNYQQTLKGLRDYIAYLNEIIKRGQ